MNFLQQDNHHESCEETNISLLVGWPECDSVELLLKIGHLDNDLGLAYVEHLTQENRAAVDHFTSLLVDEAELDLVSKERLVRRSGEVVLQNMKN
jgi:hypothetical protein